MINPIALQSTDQEDDHNAVITLSCKEKPIILVDDIIYLKAQNAAIEVVTKHGKYWVWQRLKSLYAMLPSDSFRQSHRSYVVNIKHIMDYDYPKLLMSNSDNVLVSRNNKRNFLRFRK